jgi:hypothetical protein
VRPSESYPCSRSRRLCLLCQSSSSPICAHAYVRPALHAMDGSSTRRPARYVPGACVAINSHATPTAGGVVVPFASFLSLYSGDDVPDLTASAPPVLYSACVGAIYHASGSGMQWQCHHGWDAHATSRSPAARALPGYLARSVWPMETGGASGGIYSSGSDPSFSPMHASVVPDSPGARAGGLARSDLSLARSLYAGGDAGAVPSLCPLACLPSIAKLAAAATGLSLFQYSQCVATTLFVETYGHLLHLICLRPRPPPRLRRRPPPVTPIPCVHDTDRAIILLCRCMHACQPVR